MRLNDKDYALFDYEDGHGTDGVPADNPFRRGDVVIRPKDKAIGVVIQIHDASELRTDMFGNECINEMRLATEEEIIKLRPSIL